MEYWLPLVYVAIVGLALLVYVILDGYDLGVGMLLPWATAEEKDVMIASIGPFWDANETWIVLGVGVLLAAFPLAHGVILETLYIPVSVMLLGLILRGVAFELRVKAGDHRRRLWNRAFFTGSLLASVSQGWMLGAYITGFRADLTGLAFAALISVTLPSLYIMFGAAWLLMKSEHRLFDKAVAWAQLAFLPMGLCLLLLSIATPWISEAIALRWFSLPNAVGLIPIPLSCIIVYGALFWILNHTPILRHGYSWTVFAGLVFICIMAALGLAYSIFPDIVISRMTIWEASASVASLQFTLVGVMISLPAIIFYTIMVYRIFHGRATKLSYE